MFLLSRIVQANNKRCNLLGTIIGIFLHTCNAPDRVIDVLCRSSSSISTSAVNDAINSLSASAAQKLKEEGKTFMYSYVLDNFDVQLKHKETTVEQSKDTLFHLTSAALVQINHATLDDLKCSNYLWERSRYNDLRTIHPPKKTYHDLVLLYADPVDEYDMTRRERFNAWQFMVDLCTHGPAYFHRFRKHIQDPEEVEKIPVVRTIQIPARSMHYSNATVDGNISAASDLLDQCGIEDTRDYVIPFHGDLGTYERFRTAQADQSIEETPERRLQYIEFVPGLFHTEMSCANALYKIFLEKKKGHSDETSLYHNVEVLYPNDSARIANNKGTFQMNSDCLLKTGAADRLEYWRIHTGCKTLDDLANRFPTIDKLYAHARALAKECSASSVKSDTLRRKPMKERNQQHENILKRIEFFLLYEETRYAMRHGDIGRVETCLITWIPIFRGSGKHKYANMLTEFLLDVHFIYPPGLRKAIRYNWLCNLKGTPDGFRGVDWLLELNNLLTKVIYGGSGSNHTVDRIIKESILIQLYRDCKHVVEEQFLVSPKTMRHGRPDFAKSFNVLSQMAISSSLLTEKPGRESGYHIPDVIHIGMEKYNAELRRPARYGERPENADDTTDNEIEDPEDSNYEVMPTDETLYE